MSRMKPEDVIAGKGRPFTGKEYLESLRDDREVYVYGGRVADVGDTWLNPDDAAYPGVPGHAKAAE
jgi:hypothetical protein